MRHALATLLAAAVLVPAPAQELPGWAGRIRRDHPRLFFNAETLPEVRARALGPEKAWYREYRTRADRLARELLAETTIAPRELGPQAAQLAFVHLVSRDPKYLAAAKRALETSLCFYERCYEERKSVSWYSTSRVHATLAWDWLYDDLSREERSGTMSRLVQVIQKVLTARPRIHRENHCTYQDGFYGIDNCKWFIGCSAFGTGIERKLVEAWLVRGHDENLKLLEHRAKACGDDGGGASPTLGYVLGAYPWSEQNFLYTWRSATGQNIAPQWPHSAWLANYVIWNWIETGGPPLEFGWGDTPHTTNRLPIGHLYTHLANIRHLYGRKAPEAAALARYLQERLPEGTYSGTWFFYPFLLTDLERSPPPFEPRRLPHARHFETMGQVFMRSGTGARDTYCLFTAGGILRQHRHYDALNFVIYHRGHLALDSGTRYREDQNGQHLKSYYAQTVAHNCVLIHQPKEPPAPYWGSGPEVEANHGGQHHQLGSTVAAFETDDHFVYVAGDGTPSYQHGRPGGLPQKTEQVTRQLVFLLPDIFVIFDRVNATDPTYKKTWLLHTANEATIAGDLVTAAHREGKMLCRTLLPETASITSIGGPGKEFQAAGRNWSIDSGNLDPEELAMMGRWRIEVSPDKARNDDLFLHVIRVGDRSLNAVGDVRLIRRDQTAGARITARGTTWTLTFATTGPLRGHIKATGRTTLNRRLTTTVTPQAGIVP